MSDYERFNAEWEQKRVAQIAALEADNERLREALRLRLIDQEEREKAQREREERLRGLLQDALDHPGDPYVAERIAAEIGATVQPQAIVECYGNPYLLDTQDKVDWANRHIKNGLAWRLGDHCHHRPADKSTAAVQDRGPFTASEQMQDVNADK